MSDPAIGERVRSRDQVLPGGRNGGFVQPFDPYEVNFHYTEANAWQYGIRTT